MVGRSHLHIILYFTNFIIRASHGPSIPYGTLTEVVLFTDLAPGLILIFTGTIKANKTLKSSFLAKTSWYVSNNISSNSSPYTQVLEYHCWSFGDISGKYSREGGDCRNSLLTSGRSIHPESRRTLECPFETPPLLPTNFCDSLYLCVKHSLLM